MAAYAALVTLMNTIEQIQHHPRPLISLDENQVIFLTEKVTFLQKFLEDYSHGRNTNEADGLENWIADAARKAEHIIESHLVDQIFAQPPINLLEVVSHVPARFKSLEVKTFHGGLQEVVDDMDLIKQKVMDEIKETTTQKNRETTTPIKHRDSTCWDPLRSSLNVQKVAVVGLDDVLIEMMGMLTSQEPMRQIIPIAGMGGMGKTTLARHVYSNLLIKEHFDVCAWTTISQQYNLREIFVQVLSQTSKEEAKEDLLGMSENDLKEKLHKCLAGKRYLIVLDDIWDIEVWDKIRFFFPDYYNGSRILVTTRLSNLASQVNGSYCLKMKLLDEVESWKLFCDVVFGEESCPDSLEMIGKKIARGCKGLPLSICVVGGVLLLANSKDEVQYWEHILKNLTSVVISDDNERCLKILHLSYSQLPAHLRPCFLHMGVFAEDEKIRVSKLIELWVGEGFLKPIDGKTLEVVAQEYLNELIHRNLISVHSLGCIGAVKYCNIHDLLRDFCLRQAKKERFNIDTEMHSLSIPRSSKTIHDRRFIFELESHEYVIRSLQLASSLYYHSWKDPVHPNSRLLRIWRKCSQRFPLRYGDFLEHMFHFDARLEAIARSSSSIDSNVNIFTMYNWMVLMWPSAIWNMPHLRHVVQKKLFELSDPPPSGDPDIILGNLQTLTRIKNFKCSEEMIKRIPNIKKLQTCYSYRWDGQKEASFHFLHNIDRLCKLESFHISFLPIPIFWQNLTLPNSLTKLSIRGFAAEEVLDKIGALPHLVKLVLTIGTFDKGEWETVEGQFRSLRFLQLKECYKLECWKTESSHFPRLEHLTVWDVQELKEIPSEIGDISTLRIIHVRVSSKTVVDSAMKIKQEQEDLGNDGLQVLFDSPYYI